MMSTWKWFVATMAVAGAGTLVLPSPYSYTFVSLVGITCGVLNARSLRS